ncbi:MAG: hypothetical protein ACLR23_03655 [Clostridia bacterium]|uniref:Uncharacterized protein n=1 Tax=Bianquea renquensis TaxID=2763661 RepID=A0A926I1P9_9FIRM|nr:hypothetical protein [Bianquea renquensis]MBC8544489.1 hypothetical protein [Bianquea renquensis]
MHAGEANNSIGQRAHEDKFHAATGETTIPAEIQNKKCTPARRTTTSASGHRQIPCRRRQNDQDGGDTE